MSEWVICPKCLGAYRGYIGEKCIECGTKVVATPLYPGYNAPSSLLTERELLVEMGLA